MDWQYNAILNRFQSLDNSLTDSVTRRNFSTTVKPRSYPNISGPVIWTEITIDWIWSWFIELLFQSRISVVFYRFIWCRIYWSFFLSFRCNSTFRMKILRQELQKYLKSRFRVFLIYLNFENLIKYSLGYDGSRDW